MIRFELSQLSHFECINNVLSRLPIAASPPKKKFVHRKWVGGAGSRYSPSYHLQWGGPVLGSLKRLVLANILGRIAPLYVIKTQKLLQSC